jgi:hypothetical protein
VFFYDSIEIFYGSIYITELWKFINDVDWWDFYLLLITLTSLPKPAVGWGASSD